MKLWSGRARYVVASDVGGADGYRAWGPWRRSMRVAQFHARRVERRNPGVLVIALPEATAQREKDRAVFTALTRGLEASD